MRKKPQVVYKMIDNIDDILNILKSRQEENVNLILRNNDLTGLVYELLNIGYALKIEYKAGKISMIFFEFNATKFIIKTQQLAPDEVDGDIVVNTR